MYITTYIVYMCTYMHEISNTYKLTICVKSWEVYNVYPQTLPLIASPYFPSASYRYFLKVEWDLGWFYSLLLNTNAFLLRQLSSGFILVFLNMEGWAVISTKLSGRYPKQGLFHPRVSVLNFSSITNFIVTYLYIFFMILKLA